MLLTDKQINTVKNLNLFGGGDNTTDVFRVK